jgi:hypothetical protein
MVGMLTNYLRESTLAIESPERSRIQHDRQWISLEKNKYKTAPEEYRCKESDMAQLSKWSQRGFEVALFQKGTKNSLLRHTSLDVTNNKFTLKEIQQIASSHIVVVNNDHFYIVDVPTTLRLDRLIGSLTAQIMTGLNQYVNALAASNKPPLGDSSYRSQSLISRSTYNPYYREYILMSNVPPRYRNANDHKSLMEEIVSLTTQAHLEIDIQDLEKNIKEQLPLPIYISKWLCDS